MRLILQAALISATLILSSCAQHFPRPQATCCDSNPSGNEIFQQTFKAHGGEQLHQLNDIHLDIVGDWKFLITRIQPLVTDHRYRVRSKEVLFPQIKAYHASYEGPKGKKWVLCTREDIQVFYNAQRNTDDDVLSATALTADSFYHFLLGPLSLPSNLQWQRLSDGKYKEKPYHRIYTQLRPGFGLSKVDELVLWVDPTTNLTFRTNITLEGHKSTQGAHVDVSFLKYETLQGFTFPTKFFERVLGPIKIDAHAWDVQAITINRGTSIKDLTRP